MYLITILALVLMLSGCVLEVKDDDDLAEITVRIDATCKGECEIRVNGTRKQDIGKASASAAGSR